MSLPKFKPEQWALYEQEDVTGGFGKIVGASFDGDSWYYSIHGSITDTTYASVHQDEITHIYESGSWIESHHETGGQTTAYTEQN